MDYNTSLQDCDKEIGIIAPTVKELQKRIDAVKTWYPENLNEVSNSIECSNNFRLECEEQKFKIDHDVLVHNILYVCELVS